MIRIILFSLVVADCAFAASPNFNELMDAGPCRKEVTAAIGAPLQKQSWRPKMVSIPGKHLMPGIAFRDTREQKSYRVWTEKNEAFFAIADGNTKKETITSWNKVKGCKPSVVTKNAHEPRAFATKGFTDDDLKNTMKQNPMGLIYVWSPYMPWSVRGLKEIKEASKAQGTALTVLLDPKANIADAKKWLGKDGVQSSDFTPVASKELTSRDMTLHYPILFLYKDGFVSNHDYVGHKKAAVYKRWIASELSELKKDMK